jgi:O-acetyl-ADP-ribose deacetylase (regulator of RNase III)
MATEGHMIEFKKGDILAEDAEALVNTVNCVGVMGRGVALQFKKAFPENFKAYAAACDRNEVRPGQMFVFETDQLTNPRFIISFPTKRHWRGKSRLEDIEAGLGALAAEIRRLEVKSIAIPPLGSGLGRLDWAEVRPRIERALQVFNGLKVVIFEPGGGPSESGVNRSTAVPDMTPGRAALVGLMDRYLRGLLDPFVTLLEVHKLMYFMQEAGEPLRLKYSKGPYGPYAENLRHVLHAVEGHFVAGYLDGGDAPDKHLTLVPGAVDEATAFLASEQETLARYERVSELVEGFESPFGLELLSTVHWIARAEPDLSLEEVTEEVYSWSDRKKQFSRRQIGVAVEALARRGWIEREGVSGG